MPNPFASLGAIDVMGTIQNMLQRQATLRDTQLLGDEREQIIALRKQEIQERQNTMQVLARELQGGISATDKSSIPDESDSPITLAQKQVRRFQQEAQQLSQTARELAQGGGTPAVAQDYLRRAKEAEAKVIPAMRELRLEQAQQAKIIGELAGAANAENFDNIFGQLEAQDPRIGRKYNFDRDANDRPVWGDKTQRTMTTLRDTSIAAKDQIDLKRKADEDKQKAADREETRTLNKKRADELDTKIAIGRVNAERAQAGKPLLGHEGVGERTPAEAASAKRLRAIADKEPTKDSVSSAAAYIRSTAKDEWPDKEFDDTLPSFAKSVAAKSNELRAEAAKNGEPIELDEARDQAFNLLKPFVKETTEGGINLPFVGRTGGKSVLSFRRAGVPAPTPKQETPEIQKRFEGDAAMKGNKLGQKTPQGYEVFNAAGKLIGHYE